MAGGWSPEDIDPVGWVFIFFKDDEQRRVFREQVKTSDPRRVAPTSADVGDQHKSSATVDNPAGTKLDPTLREFLREHPEHAEGCPVYRMPGNTAEQGITPDTLEAYLRWCLTRGHGNAAWIEAFLAEGLAQLQAMEREDTASRKIRPKS